MSVSEVVSKGRLSIGLVARLHTPLATAKANCEIGLGYESQPKTIIIGCC